jgi:hypothetical protein
MVKFDKIYTQFVEGYSIIVCFKLWEKINCVLEHTSEVVTEYLGQNVPSLASYSVNVLEL